MVIWGNSDEIFQPDLKGRKIAVPELYNNKETHHGSMVQSDASSVERGV